MNTFAAAFVVVWLAVLAYVARLGSRHRQLQHTVEAIRQQLDKTETSEAVENFHSKAA